MKKFAMLLLLFICLSSNIGVSAVNVFKEGVYKAADLNFSPNSTYNVQNISPTSSVYMILFNENQLTLQSIRLDPNSAKYNLLPLKPAYRIAIVGNGEVFIAEKTL